jgi:hypothetical protein
VGRLQQETYQTVGKISHIDHLHVVQLPWQFIGHRFFLCLRRRRERVRPPPPLPRSNIMKDIPIVSIFRHPADAIYIRTVQDHEARPKATQWSLLAKA